MLRSFLGEGPPSLPFLPSIASGQPVTSEARHACAEIRVPCIALGGCPKIGNSVLSLGDEATAVDPYVGGSGLAR